MRPIAHLGDAERNGPIYKTATMIGPKRRHGLASTSDFSYCSLIHLGVYLTKS